MKFNEKHSSFSASHDRWNVSIEIECIIIRLNGIEWNENWIIRILLIKFFCYVVYHPMVWKYVSIKILQKICERKRISIFMVHTSYQRDARGHKSTHNEKCETLNNKQLNQWLHTTHKWTTTTKNPKCKWRLGEKERKKEINLSLGCSWICKVANIRIIYLNAYLCTNAIVKSTPSTMNRR